MDKKTKKIVLITSAIVLLFIVAIIISSVKAMNNRIVKITASYEGSHENGYAVSKDDFDVDGRTKNGEYVDIKDFSLEKDYVIHPGINYFVVNYNDLSTKQSATSPTFVDGKYVGTVKEMHHMIKSFTRVYVPREIEFSEAAGDYYKITDGSGIEVNLSYSKDGETATGSDVPTAIVYNTVLSIDDMHGPIILNFIDIAAVGLTIGDADITHEEAVKTLKLCISDTISKFVDNGGAPQTKKSIGGIDVTTTIIPGPKGALFVVSYEET